MIFVSEILAKSDFFWVYERRQDFFGVTKNNRGILGGPAEIGLRDFFGYAKKSSSFLGRKNFEVVIFLGRKYEPLSPPPPPLPRHH